MDKTAGELLTALSGGKIVWVEAVNENNVGTEFENGLKYSIRTFGQNNDSIYIFGVNAQIFNADNSEGYPKYRGGK